MSVTVANGAMVQILRKELDFVLPLGKLPMSRVPVHFFSSTFIGILGIPPYKYYMHGSVNINSLHSVITHFLMELRPEVGIK